MANKYYPRLDGVRFVAIMMVIMAHFASSLGRKFAADFYGVNLFFVLSGYLITGILISNKFGTFKKAYLNFVIRRVLRIFPAYYFTILVLFLIGSQLIYQDLPYLLSYTYNYHIDFSQAPAGHMFFWSLSVEEQFYLIFPFIVIGLKDKRKTLVAVLLIIIIVAYLQVFFNLFGIKQFDYVGLLTNMAPLTIGALGAVLNADDSKIKIIFNSFLFEILLLVALPVVLFFGNFEFRILFSSLINVFLVLKASRFEYKITVINNLLENRLFVYIGRVSYGIYLYHGIVGHYVVKNIFNPLWSAIPFEKLKFLSFLNQFDWVFRVGFVTAASVLVAGISFRYFETYFLKLKDKYFPN